MRRAQRSYHCHACEQDFRQLVDLNDLSGIKCPHCESDFFEEKKSFEENKVEEMPVQQPEP